MRRETLHPIPGQKYLLFRSYFTLRNAFKPSEFMRRIPASSSFWRLTMPAPTAQSRQPSARSACCGWRRTGAWTGGPVASRWHWQTCTFSPGAARSWAAPGAPSQRCPFTLCLRNHSIPGLRLGMFEDSRSLSFARSKPCNFGTAARAVHLMPLMRDGWRSRVSSFPLVIRHPGWLIIGVGRVHCQSSYPLPPSSLESLNPQLNNDLESPVTLSSSFLWSFKQYESRLLTRTAGDWLGSHVRAQSTARHVSLLVQMFTVQV
jgi:hypothetical protein